jgi:hypothetical protein
MMEQQRGPGIVLGSKRPEDVQTAQRPERRRLRAAWIAAAGAVAALVAGVALLPSVATAETVTIAPVVVETMKPEGAGNGPVVIETMKPEAPGKV